MSLGLLVLSCNGLCKRYFDGIDSLFLVFDYGPYVVVRCVVFSHPKHCLYLNPILLLCLWLVFADG